MITLTKIFIGILILSAISIFGQVIDCVKALKQHSSEYTFSAFRNLVFWIIVFVASINGLRETNDIAELPTALEVYQGKTTIQYNIVGGEIQDSVVIYRNTIKDLR